MHLFTGDTVKPKFDIHVTKTVVDSGWKVDGTITINNPGQAVEIASIVDVISKDGAPDVVANVSDCTNVVQPDAPSTLPPGPTTCKYTADLDDGTERTNTVTVTTVAGAESFFVEPVVFDTPPTMIGPNKIKVIDRAEWITDAVDPKKGDQKEAKRLTVGKEPVVSEGIIKTKTRKWFWIYNDKWIDYTDTLTCDDAGRHKNTAKIYRTDLKDTVRFRVICHELEVEKTAKTAADHHFKWEIDKTAIGSSRLMVPTKLDRIPVRFKVTVDGRPYTTSPRVYGTIWIHNPNPKRDAIVKSITDVVSVGKGKIPVGAEVTDCDPREGEGNGYPAPHTLSTGETPDQALIVPKGGSLHCKYSVELPDKLDPKEKLKNTATVAIKNYIIYPDYSMVEDGMTDFSGMVWFKFNPKIKNVFHECVWVKDETKIGPVIVPQTLGTVCTDGDKSPKGQKVTNEGKKLETNDKPPNGDTSPKHGGLPRMFHVLVWVAFDKATGPVIVKNTAWLAGKDDKAPVVGKDGPVMAMATVEIDPQNPPIIKPFPPKGKPPISDPKGTSCMSPKDYWKSHSGNGGQPYDGTWLFMGKDGDQTPFYKSGKSHLDVLGETAKKGQNAYYTMAQAYVVAKLYLMMDGQDAPADVTKAVKWASKHFAKRGVSFTSKKRLVKIKKIENGKRRSVELRKLKRVKKNMRAHGNVLHKFGGHSMCTPII